MTFTFCQNLQKIYKFLLKRRFRLEFEELAFAISRLSNPIGRRNQKLLLMVTPKITGTADVQVFADLLWLGVESLPKGFKYLAGQRIEYGEFNPCVFPEVQMCWL